MYGFGQDLRKATPSLDAKKLLQSIKRNDHNLGNYDNHSSVIYGRCWRSIRYGEKEQPSSVDQLKANLIIKLRPQPQELYFQKRVV